MNNSQKIIKWHDMAVLLYDQGQQLIERQYFYTEYLRIVVANPDIGQPIDFHQWVAHNHYDALLMNLRRIVDDHRETASLHNLLMEIHDNFSIINKSWFLRNLPNNNNSKPDMYEFMGQYFDENYGDQLGNISQSKIEDDLAIIYKIRLKVGRFIDNTLAHKNHGAKGQISIETKTIESVLHPIEEIIKKYLNLLTHKYAGLTTLKRERQYDWQEIFTKPWIKIHP